MKGAWTLSLLSKEKAEQSENQKLFDLPDNWNHRQNCYSHNCGRWTQNYSLPGAENQEQEPDNGASTSRKENPYNLGFARGSLWEH